MTDASSDRLVDPFDPDAEVPSPTLDGVEERTLRASDSDTVLLDAEGNPVVELDVDRPDEIAQRSATVRQLAVDEQVWQFGHVIVDEAQDLTPMQWRMVVRRSRSGAVTMLGDLAQRSVGDPGIWDDHLPPEFSLFTQQNLTTNYRSPAEINDLAATVLAQLAPDLPPSRAVRRSGHVPRIVEVASIADGLGAVVSELAEEMGAEANPTARPAVIGFDLPTVNPAEARVLSPWKAKGLEFDSVVVVEPAHFLDEPNGLSLLYVALTRSTGRLTIVHQRPLPTTLAEAVTPS